MIFAVKRDLAHSRSGNSKFFTEFSHISAMWYCFDCTFNKVDLLLRKRWDMRGGVRKLLFAYYDYADECYDTNCFEIIYQMSDVDRLMFCNLKEAQTIDV